MMKRKGLKRWQVLLWAVITIILALRVWTESGYKQSAMILTEKNRLILEWIGSRHGQDWAKRIDEWAEERAIKEIERM